MDEVDEAAARRQLEAAIGGALWRYAEAVTGCRRDASGQIVEGPSFAADRRLHLARLAGARRAREVLAAAETAAAADAIGHGASYPMLAAAAGMARQVAWRRYRPGRAPARDGGAAPGAAVSPG